MTKTEQVLNDTETIRAIWRKMIDAGIKAKQQAAVEMVADAAERFVLGEPLSDAEKQAIIDAPWIAERKVESIAEVEAKYGIDLSSGKDQTVHAAIFCDETVEMNQEQIDAMTNRLAPNATDHFEPLADEPIIVEKQ